GDPRRRSPDPAGRAHRPGEDQVSSRRPGGPYEDPSASEAGGRVERRKIPSRIPAGRGGSSRATRALVSSENASQPSAAGRRRPDGDAVGEGADGEVLLAALGSDLVAGDGANPVERRDPPRQAHP